MLIYIFLLIYILLCGLLLYGRSHQSKQYIKIFLFLSFGAMSLVLGLRGASVGEDTQHYLSMFNTAKRITWSTMLRSPHMRTVFYTDQWGYSQTVENGWLALCKIIQIFTGNGQIFLFIVALLTCALFAKFIYDNSNNILYSTIIFMCESMFMFAFNGARQELAIAITTLAYTSFRKQKYKTGIAWIVLASLIHNTALVTLIMLPLFLVTPKNHYKDFKYIIAATSTLPFLVNILSNIISALFPAYAHYFTMRFWETSAGGIIVLWIVEILLILLMYYKKFSRPYSFILSCLVLTSFAFEMMGTRIGVIQRISYYFRAYLILFFPLADKYINKKNRLIARGIITILLFMLYFSYARTDARQYIFCWDL